MVLVQFLDPLGQLDRFRALVNGEHKQDVIRIQGELIHGIDNAHVVQDEEEDRGTFRARSIRVSGQIYLLLRLFGDN